MKIHLSNILQGSGPDAMGCASTQVDADGLVYVFYVCEESAVAKHIHRDLIIEENPVWIMASGVVIHVVRDLVKARAWRGLGVVLVVGPGVVFCLSVAIVCFVVDMHT